jgi:dTDP-4-dehydrorhamnose 3,5-epimerase
VLQPDIFEDSRGFFSEVYHRKRWSEVGIHCDFVQDNHSHSKQGTLRGLHYQLSRPQGKLCRVVSGEVLDVAVDIRVGSPTFGQWAMVRLSATNRHQLFIPPGFAHGFVVVSETADFLYKCSDYYDPQDQYGIRWNDPALAIPWGNGEPRLSDKDAQYPMLIDVAETQLPKWYPS